MLLNLEDFNDEFNEVIVQKDYFNILHSSDTSGISHVTVQSPSINATSNLVVKEINQSDPLAVHKVKKNLHRQVKFPL